MPLALLSHIRRRKWETRGAREPQIALDLSSAYNEHDRRASQGRLEALQAARPGGHAWADLASAHHVDTGHPSRTHTRHGGYTNGL